MQSRVIPFHDMETVIRYAQYVASLAGAEVMFVLPNAIVVKYNENVIMVVARDEGGG